MDSDDRRKQSVRLTEEGVLTSQIAETNSGEFPYTLFLGAGCSVASGIPSVVELVEEWCHESYCHIHALPYPVPSEAEDAKSEWMQRADGKSNWLAGLKELLGSTSDYGTLFQYTRKTMEERQSYIERLLDGHEPSPGYAYLSGVIADGRINRVLTTNFDDLLADALVKFYDIKPIVCAFDSAVTSFNNSSLRPKIVKLHGDFLFDNLLNTDEETQELSQNMEEKMVEMCEDKGLIVIGFAGNDTSIMDPIQENLRKNRKFLTKGLHWCVFHKPEKPGAIYVGEDEVPEKLNQLRKRYPDRVFLYNTTGFDSFMENAFAKCQLDLAPSILEPYKNNAAVAFYKACERLEVTIRLSSTLREHMNLALMKLDEEPDKYERALRKANRNWRDGADLRDSGGDNDGAQRLFLEAIATVEPLLEAADMPTHLRFQCVTRIVGCKIGLAKLQEDNKERARLLDEGIQLALRELDCETEGFDENQLALFTSVQFNAICALGLKAAISGRIPKTVRTQVERVCSEMMRTRIGRSKLNKLETDSDTRVIRNLINQIRRSRG